MRRAFGYASAVLLLVFPFLVHAAFPTVATNTWSPAQSLTSPRSGAAAVLLQDGRLLITGGNNGASSVASVDIVDTAGNITAGPPMNMARSQHTATVLQDGRVLVVGGVDVSGNPVGTAEIFDPSVNAGQANPWTTTGPLVQARSGQTATLLHEGTVLIAGGVSGSQVLSTMEVFNAAAGPSGSFTMVSATLSSPRAKHAAALLEDGRVLIVGGWDGTTIPAQPPATIGTPRALASTDIYDPSAQQVRAGPALNVARMSLTATTQLDGQIFVAGGNDGTQDLASAETFDPIASPQPATFTLSNLSLTTPRSSHVAILLPHNGGTLLVGGSSNGTAIASAELYMPVYLSQNETATLSAIPNAMSSPRAYATGVALSNGSATSVNDGLLLVAGGVDAAGKSLSSTEFFGFAWVKTDALDYPPGTPVTITGGGFQPGETVTLHLQEFPYYDAPADVTAVVQPDGTFSNSQFAPDNFDLNTGFFLTATGSVSGRQAQTVFSDGQSFDNVTLAFSGSTPGTVSNNLNADTCTWNGTSASGNGCSFTNVIPNGSSVVFTASAPSNWSSGTKGWTLTGCNNGSTTCTVATGGNNSGTVNVTFTGTAPQITSAASTSAFTYGVAGTTFTVTATGVPTPSLKVSGAFPSWATFTDKGNGIATISGTPTAAGTSNFTISATNGVGSGAAQSFSLTVTPASLTITPDGTKSKTYGQTFTAFTGTTTGLVGSDAITVTYGSTGAAAAAAVGSYDITVASYNFTTGSASNYQITQNTAAKGLSVSAAALTITAKPASKTYGQSLSFAGTEFTTGGLLNSDTVTSVTLTSSGAAATATVVGSPYDIVPSSAVGTGLSNYTISYANGTLTVNPAAATVIGDSLSKTYGEANPTLTAKVTGVVNGDTLNYTLATTAGQFTGVGNYPITVSLGSNPNYTITPTDGTLTVNPRPATVIADSFTKTYGDANPALTAKVSGSVNNDTLNYTLATTATQFSGVGNYPITVTVGSNPNYTVTPTNGTLTIDPRPATVIADSFTKTYGDANPALTAKVSGSVNNDTLNYTLATTATQFSGVGNYPITVTVGSNPNYTVTPTNGNLTIDPRAVSVVADNQTKMYGDVNPNLTAQVSGTVNNDVLNYSLATTATQFSGVGNYPITVTVGANPNYTVTPTNSTLTVNQRPATVTADNKSRNYGDANPPLTATVTGTVNGDSLNYTLDTTATATSGVGPYPITVTLGANANYAVTPANGTLTVNQRPATVTADNKSRNYGDANPALTAVVTGAANGDTLNYSLDTTATATSGVGPYPITVNVGANPNYTVTSTNGTLTITPRQATVTADNLSKTYGDVTPDLTAKTSGTVNGDSLNYTLSTEATQFSAVGTYTITVNLGSNPNYSVTGTNGVLTVNPHPATITPANASRTYGDANPVFTATVTGTLNGDTLNYSLSTDATQATGVGTYPINVVLGSNPNYNVTSGTGTLTISPRAASVTAINASKTYGDPNPTFGAMVAGTVNGDVLSYTLSSTAVQLSSVGTYPISVMLGSNPNYNVAATNGTLTINPATPAAVSISNVPSPALIGGSFTPAVVVTSSPSGDPGTTSVMSTTPGICTVSGGNVQFVGVGTCSLTASVAATTNYNGKTGAAQSFSITYGFQGLAAPYAPPPVTFNVQRTMPIVWQYTNANGAVVNSAASNPLIQISGPYTCGQSDTMGDITVNSAGSSGYQYNTTTNTWQFNWQVKGNAPGCYNIYIVNGQTGQTSGPFPIAVTSH
ncbi:MAG TPA: MBG domain-containing protein [Acidobacteriaceae bacterium]|nr:MBG domain-containing protein [Acidobacteriaceae bacterium]